MDSVSTGMTTDPPSGKVVKVKRDYHRLKERQLEASTSEKFREKGGQIRDDNRPAIWMLNNEPVPKGTTGALLSRYRERTYQELSKIKMPLILDQIQDSEGYQREAWTIDEILVAMRPCVISIANQYSRKRAAFQFDEAESLGNEAILIALWTDLGLAWFAGYCYEKIDAAIRRGAQTSGTIRASERRHEYRDKVRSTDEPIGEGDGTLAETIRETTPIVRRARCGDYYIITIRQRIDAIREALADMGLPDIAKNIAGIVNAARKATKTEEQGLVKVISSYLRKSVNSDQYKAIEAYVTQKAKTVGEKTLKSTGAIFVHTCKSGMLPDGTPCDRCDGTGRIIIYEEKPIRTPADLAAEHLRLEDFKKVWAELTSDLTDLQREILMLKEGLDEEAGGRKRDATEVAAILKERDCRQRRKVLEEKHKALTYELDHTTDPGSQAELRVLLDQNVVAQAQVVGCGSKNLVTQKLARAYTKIREKQAGSRELTEAIDRILDLDEVGD